MMALHLQARMHAKKKRALMIMKHCGHVMISAIDVWKAVTI
jgi:hypothetical protein